MPIIDSRKNIGSEKPFGSQYSHGHEESFQPKVVSRLNISSTKSREIVWPTNERERETAKRERRQPPRKEEETHGGCQKVGPKVAKFLDR